MTARSEFLEFVQDEENSLMSILGATTALLKDSGGLHLRIAEAVDRAVYSEIEKMKAEKMQ